MLRTLAAALLITACSSAPPGLPAIPEGEDPMRWEEDILAFEAQDPVAPGQVVFVGSSSIRLWSSLAEDMAPVPVVNRGFGGSRIFDSIYWLDPLVTRHDPSVVVVFSGTNDLQNRNTRDPEWVVDRFDEMVSRLRSFGCGAPLVYIAISPTPSRKQHLEAVLETNRRIAARCEADPKLHFVDTATDLLNGDGQPDPRWFIGDGLHLNPAGYAAWTAEIQPVVARLYARASGH